MAVVKGILTSFEQVLKQRIFIQDGVLTISCMYPDLILGLWSTPQMHGVIATGE